MPRIIIPLCEKHLLMGISCGIADFRAFGWWCVFVEQRMVDGREK